MSGDFYLVVDGPGGSTVLVVGDVVGKGAAAARRADDVGSILASLARSDDEPCRLLELANRSIVERAGTTDEFTTVVCVSVRPGDRTVRWAYAGHVPPLWLDTGVEVNGVVPGFPLGIAERIGCTEGCRRLGPSEGMVLFTDGLSEAHRPGAELFGSDGVARELGSVPGAPVDAVVDRLERAGSEHARGALRDDVCVLAFRVP